MLELMLLCGWSQPLPQGPTAVHDVVALEHVVLPAVPAGPPPWGTMLQRDVDRIDLVGALDASAPVTAERLGALTIGLASRAVENQRLHVTPLASSMLLVGDAAEVAQSRARLRQVAAVVARPVTVEFALWDAADRETPPAFAAPADYTRFAGNRAPVWRRVVTGRVGDALSLEHLRWSRYVRDLEVDVAQKQSITRPLPDSYAEGGHAVVRTLPLAGADEFAVHVQFAVAQRRGVVRTLPTGMPGAPDLELPTLETDYGAFSGRIVNGGALIATLRGHADGGGQRMLTVRVSAQAPLAPSVHDGVGFHPCGALTSTVLTRYVPPGAVEEADDARDHHVVAADVLTTLVRDALGDGDGVSVECTGNWLLVLGSPLVQSAAASLLHELQERLVRNTTVAHVAALPVAPAGGTPLLHELTLPTLHGRELVVARSLESSIVADIFSAIAQEAAALDPGVDTLRSGCWLTARVTPRDDGVHLRLRVLQQHAVTPQARSIMPNGGTWMPAETATTLAGHDGPAGNTQVLEHGDGPTLSVDGRLQRSSLTTTLRW